MAQAGATFSNRGVRPEKRALPPWSASSSRAMVMLLLVRPAVTILRIKCLFSNLSTSAMIKKCIGPLIRVHLISKKDLKIGNIVRFSTLIVKLPSSINNVQFQ